MYKLKLNVCSLSVPEGMCDFLSTGKDRGQRVKAHWLTHSTVQKYTGAPLKVRFTLFSQAVYCYI